MLMFVGKEENPPIAETGLLVVVDADVGLVGVVVTVEVELDVLDDTDVPVSMTDGDIVSVNEVLSVNLIGVVTYILVAVNAEDTF